MRPEAQGCAYARPRVASAAGGLSRLLKISEKSAGAAPTFAPSAVFQNVIFVAAEGAPAAEFCGARRDLPARSRVGARVAPPASRDALGRVARRGRGDRRSRRGGRRARSPDPRLGGLARRRARRGPDGTDGRRLRRRPRCRVRRRGDADETERRAFPAPLRRGRGGARGAGVHAPRDARAHRAGPARRANAPRAQRRRHARSRALGPGRARAVRHGRRLAAVVRQDVLQGGRGRTRRRTRRNGRGL